MLAESTLITIVTIISSPVSLLDHAATLSAYLTDYRNEANLDKRSGLSSHFSTYLFSLCWPKMHSHIMSWPFIAFIYNISGMTTAVGLAEAIRKYDWQKHHPGSGDRSLAGFLARPARDSMVRKLEVAAGGSIQQLLAIMQTPSGNTSRPYLVNFYLEEMCMDFHCLLLGCLILYAKSLYQIKRCFLKRMPMDVTQKKVIEQEPAKDTANSRLITCFDNLESYGRLLLLLLSSTSFVTHLRLMLSAGSLQPHKMLQDVYNKLASAKFSSNDVTDGNSENDDTEKNDDDWHVDEHAEDNQVSNA